MKGILGLVSAISGLGVLFASMPAGTSYKLESYGVGSGGTANSTSSSYALDGISGEASGTQMTGMTYNGGSGLITTQLANVPAAPALTNPSNYYNKLKIVIDNGGNASDAKFAVAISSDNFATTQYVQNNFTIGPALGIEDYQTYALWGGAAGTNIIGLAPHTTYQVKVRAMHGNFTESGYSPTASAATIDPSLTYDIDVSATDSETSPPYSLAFNDLLPGAVVDSPLKIWLDFETNGETGGNVYIYSQNGGLKSANVSYTIASVSGDLSTLAQGFGAQSASVAQVSGGPLTAVSPFNGSTNSIGSTDTTIRKLFTTTAPVAGGRTSLLLKAKASATTPSSRDYSDVLTVVAAPNF